MHVEFHRNISNVDRIIRIVAGIVLIYLAIFKPFMIGSWLSLILGIAGAGMIIEGILAY